MPDFLRMVATLREQMQAELSRSDVLRVLIWPLAILMFGLLSAAAAQAPAWLLILLGSFLGLFLLIYGFAFIGLLVYDRDALRSEKYTLHKLAIERGVFGDSQVGLVEGEQLSPAGRAVSATPAIEGRK